MSATPPSDRKANRLAGETSPYLLQHRFNPVDWRPWGPEALDEARRQGKPIFLSIGYAACHWCHVMERESFEDVAVADFLNRHFVSIKVDREERPDVDEVYMSAVQLMAGQGGWPLTVFLTPSLEPFFGGTYFPPEDRWGRPGFLTLLRRVAHVWESRRDEVSLTAAQVAGHVRALGTVLAASPGAAPPGRREIDAALSDLAARFDPDWGGFGPAPKFPPHGAVALLLSEHARTGAPAALRMATLTLDRMAAGGIRDHVGGGFSRYSVDERWEVPHFEKMLYDQALLAPLYADAWRVTGDPRYRRVAEATLDFVRREMTDPGGGFWSSLDADSEGHEGRYYVWTPDEVEEALGPEPAAAFCRLYGIVPGGNFEGRSIPNRIDGEGDDGDVETRTAEIRAALLEARRRRPRPATDDKILAAWNGLMISAFARAHEAFGRPDDLASARRAAGFVLGSLFDGGRLLAVYRAGVARIGGFLDDHAFLARGLLDLYEADFDRSHLEAAVRIAREMVERFADESGGFWLTSPDHEELPARPRSTHDGALPSGAGVAAETLLRLAIHLDDRALREAAARALTALTPAVARAPSAFASLLRAADLLESGAVEIAVVGPREDPRTRALLEAARAAFLPRRVLAWSDGDGRGEGLLAGKTLVRGSPAAYVCRDYACAAPAVTPDALARRIRESGSPPA